MLQSYHISPLFLATNFWTVGTVVIKPVHHYGPNWYSAVHMVLWKEKKLWHSKFVIAKIHKFIQIYTKQWPCDIKFNYHLSCQHASCCAWWLLVVCKYLLMCKKRTYRFCGINALNICFTIRKQKRLRLLWRVWKSAGTGYVPAAEVSELKWT